MVGSPSGSSHGAGRDDGSVNSNAALLRSIDVTSQGKLRSGILTNGTRWRLYWAGARSISEEFLEIDLGRFLALDGTVDLFVNDESRDDIRYIYSTFPIVEREEIARWGSYRSRDLVLAWVNALMVGQSDAEIAG